MSARFTFDADFDPRWTPHFPEVAAVANAVSIAMPHVEPFVIAATRRVTNEIDDTALRGEMQRFLADEAAHYVEHRRFNVEVQRRYGALRIVDRLNVLMVAGLRRCPARIGSGFAAGFELLGIAVAMWLGPRASLLLLDSHPEARRLFLWHLAEEIDHRSIAHDVHRAAGGGVVTRTIGLLLAAFVLATGAFVGAGIAFAVDGRWYRPVSWWRLITWGIGFLWVSGPMLLSSLWMHPSGFLIPAETAGWRQGVAG